MKRTNVVFTAKFRFGKIAKFLHVAIERQCNAEYYKSRMEIFVSYIVIWKYSFPVLPL